MIDCHFCGHKMRWVGYENSEDCGGHDGGVIATLECTDCRATAVFTSYGDEDECPFCKLEAGKTISVDKNMCCNSCGKPIHKLSDPVNHPNHYTQHPSGVECIQVAEHFPFNLGCVIKYIWRAGLKGDALEDLRKALFYLQREVKLREGGTSDGKGKEGM